MVVACHKWHNQGRVAPDLLLSLILSLVHLKLLTDDLLRVAASVQSAVVKLKLSLLTEITLGISLSRI
jgi:hypothetical protein